MTGLPDYDYALLDVFTDSAFTGNPLAVVPSASGLSTDDMQKIAREFNLSETVFIFPGGMEADAALRIFTPVAELPFAGHPTVGAAIHLAVAGPEALRSRGQFVLSLPAGPVEVAIDGRTGAVRATIRAPQPPRRLDAPPLEREELAAALGLRPEELGSWPADVWSAGAPFTFVQIASRSALDRARLDPGRWEILVGPKALGPDLYLFTLEDWECRRGVSARLFAPAKGIAEDPATGSAAAALAGLLAHRLPLTTGRHRWTVEQGRRMGRASAIAVAAEVRDGLATWVEIGGTAVPIGRGTIYRTALGNAAAAARADDEDCPLKGSAAGPEIHQPRASPQR